eukprot:scaffold4672_cov78-Skeletonema_dohrnii-CCMP3373.AAC.7
MILFQPGSSIASLSKVRFTYCSSLPPNQVENLSSTLSRERELKEGIGRANEETIRTCQEQERGQKIKSPLKTKDRLCFPRQEQTTMRTMLPPCRYCTR